MIARLKRKLRYSLYRQSWNIGLIHAHVGTVAGLAGRQRQTNALDSIRWMHERRDRFAADPFIISLGDNRARIYFEELVWSENRGKISMVEWDGTQFSVPETVLDEQHHLSYPFVIQIDDTTFVLPEEGEVASLTALKVGHSGKLLRHLPVISELPLIDSTIARWNERFWLFATHRDGSENSALHIYHASDVFGAWDSHKSNPVKEAAESSRPAGQLFEYKGALFRPAQDCTDFYGAKIIINEITRIDDEVFEETPASEVCLPDSSKYNYGCHTLSYSHDMCMLDGARLESRLSKSLDRLNYLFR